MTALSQAELEAMAQEATVDCYDESEQLSGFHTMWIDAYDHWLG